MENTSTYPMENDAEYRALLVETEENVVPWLRPSNLGNVK